MTSAPFQNGDRSITACGTSGGNKPIISRYHGRRPRWCVSRAASAFALAVLAGAVDADARPRTLDREEVVELLAGNTVFGFDPRAGSEFSMFHSSQGRVRAELRDVNRRSDRSDGRWWVTDEGKLCVDWTNYRWVDSCVAVVREDESVTFVDDSGRIVSFGEMAPGNPDDL